VPLGSANYVVREIDGISDVRCLSGGEDFMCALTHAGRVVCWTFLPEGDAGPSTAPTVVPGLASGVVALAVGEEHACVQTASGEVSCWGTGAEQEPQIHYPPTPTKVEGLPANVASIAAGDGFSCALASTGGVKCWGGNKFGELGDGTTTDRATPVDVIGLPGPVTELSIHGASHACALLSSGGVWCWGAMTSTMSPNATPKEVRGMRASPKWLTTGGEWGGSCALSTDGAVQCWGDWTQDSGDAGTDTPRDIVGFDARVLTLASGDLHICAMLTSGAVACWGDNTFGQLGRAPQAGAYSAVPVLVNGL
jgi:alpha-tubulin suppressor-like RCC1 family protein